jgi:hypothetical protein
MRAVIDSVVMFLPNASALKTLPKPFEWLKATPLLADGCASAGF